MSETEIDLIIADANVKFIRGIKFMSFLASNAELDKIPFAVTAVANLIDLVEKINLESPEEKISEAGTDSAVIQTSKKKIANVVTTFIGYDFDIKI